MCFIFIFHQIYPSKSSVIIHYGEKISVTMNRRNTKGTPNINMNKIKRIITCTFA